MSSYRKAFAILFALMFIAIPLSAYDVDGEHDGIMHDSNSVVVGDFNERSDGTVSITYYNYTDEDITIDVYASWASNINSILDSKKGIVVPGIVDEDDGAQSVTVTLSFRISSPGTHFILIFATPEDVFPEVTGNDPESLPEYFNSQSVRIEVSESIWSNTSTYVVIILIVILVVIAAYLKLRGSRVPKAQGRFTAMEMERKSSKESDYDEYDDYEDEYDEPAPVVTSEKQEYVAKKPEEKKESKGGDKSEAKKETKGKQEYTGKASSGKKKQQSPQRKSSPNSRKSSKRK